MNAEQRRHVHTLRQNGNGDRRCNASAVDTSNDTDRHTRPCHDDNTTLSSNTSAGKNMSQRNVSVVSTRPVVSVQSVGTGHLSRSDLDSHADTCCVGRHAFVFEETHRTVDVSPFLSTLGRAHSVPILCPLCPLLLLMTTRTRTKLLFWFSIRLCTFQKWNTT
jgi:hypothetical protein